MRTNQLVYFFRHLSLKWKLLTIILSLSTMGLVISAIGLSFSEKIYFQISLVRNLNILAQVVGENSTAALLFTDKNAAKETLGTLRANQHIQAAGIYDPRGNLFVSFSRRHTPHHFPKDIPPGPSHHFRENDLTLFQPIFSNGKKIGTVYLFTDLEEIASRLNNFIWVYAGLLVGVLGIVTIISFKMQGWVTRPVIELANTARAVSIEKNFSIRAKKITDDELGFLVDSFNQMLEEVQKRDEKLQQAQQALKKRVKELHQEVFERRRAEEALRESEERTRMIVATALDAVITINSKGIITGWNQQAEQMFGWSKSEVLEQPLSEKIIPARYREAHHKGMDHYLATGEGPILNKRIEITALHKNGIEFPIEISISPFKMGKEIIFSSFVRDITERKQAENQLRHYAAELERSNQELEQFAYIASHDLKEPLRGIYNYATFLIEDYHDKLDEEGRSKLETLKRLTQRMEQLIDSLLYFSRVGRVDLAFAETDLNDVLATVIDNLHISLKDKGMEVRIPEKLPRIRCDRVRISEVFHNLITNAMKYNDKPHPWVEIGYFPPGSELPECINESTENTQPVFYVKDNGIGIRERHLDTIFRIFKRLHGRNKFGGGTGAGLTIVKKIIERHNGRIWVTSTVGEGTTFYFTLWEKK